MAVVEELRLAGGGGFWMRAWGGCRRGLACYERGSERGYKGRVSTWGEWVRERRNVRGRREASGERGRERKREQ